LPTIKVDEYTHVKLLELQLQLKKKGQRKTLGEIVKSLLEGKQSTMPKHLQDYCKKLYKRFLEEGDTERAEIVKNALAVLGVNVEA